MSSDFPTLAEVGEENTRHLRLRKLVPLKEEEEHDPDCECEDCCQQRAEDRFDGMRDSRD